MTSLWQVINEIESSKELAPEEWVTCTPSEERKRELNDADILQKRLSKVRVEIAHGKGIVEGGLRLGKFCREAIAVVYGEEHLQGALMGGGLRPGERELLVERIRGSMSTCEALVERLTELEARHNGHLGHINNIIAQVETKTNRAVAEITLDVARVAASDSRTMKTIGFVEMIFLPAIFISTVWGAGGVVDIDGATTNKYVFVGAILTLTVIVLSSWGFYMWYYREPLGQGHSAVLRAGLDIV
ncbi:hypothetical protein B0T14DRAFT_341375 [Immersiella caudata]|uniref:Uncharacterized protein n=1 Tax=Immersiella caudata TaxID=314043 RepID=A0AA39WAL0_9PEZI|nr:hypothetical protein B0T14DRAFT_341375 [Immersiella caudata]